MAQQRDHPCGDDRNITFYKSRDGFMARRKAGWMRTAFTDPAFQHRGMGLVGRAGGVKCCVPHCAPSYNISLMADDCPADKEMVKVIKADR
jgi:hypothetical protein